MPETQVTNEIKTKAETKVQKTMYCRKRSIARRTANDIYRGKIRQRIRQRQR